MKINLETTINTDQQTVWNLFNDPEMLKEWQPTLKSFVLQNGKFGQIGTISKYTYSEDGRDIQMTETIVNRVEPAILVALYETKGGKSTIANRFIERDDNTTLWQIEAEFSFEGAFAFFPSMLEKAIRKRLRTHMSRLKELVESQELL